MDASNFLSDHRIRPRNRQFKVTNVYYKNRGQAEVSNPEQSPKSTERKAGGLITHGAFEGREPSG
jgi:hypothetical protein